MVACNAPQTSLERSVRLAQKRLGSELSRLGELGVEERIASASRAPPPRASFVSAIERRTYAGECAIVAEVSAGSPSAPAWHAAEAAEKCVEGGADAIALRTDLESTADGLLQLQLVCRAMEARNIPVLQLDWTMHPLQVAQAKEAGAAGVQIVASVLGSGTPAIHDAILRLGMEPIVEIIHQRDLDMAEKCGARLFGVHLAVALALPNAEARILATKGLLQSLPFGALSCIGVASMDEARNAIAYGADALLLKRDMLVVGSQDVGDVLREVRYLASGDD